MDGFGSEDCAVGGIIARYWESKHLVSKLSTAKLLQKSEMRKDIVIELSYKGFS